MRPIVPIALCLGIVISVFGQISPYENPLPADPPYYRVRYEASTEPGCLAFPASYTIWIPPGVATLRGVVVHQHGCGEGSCKSGQTGAYDLHWQALAAAHGCALIGPSYEQPEGADCQKWCDPRQGSDVAFQRALADLGIASSHPELATVPWALWGHSGGGHWVGGMALLHPERVAAAWLRSGVPAVVAVEGKPTPYEIPEAALTVPMMCNLGTKEGVTEKEGRFAGVWPGVETFFRTLRSEGGQIGVAIDPFSSHDCGNQRYLAIPWLDTCLSARLPGEPGGTLRPMADAEALMYPLDPGNREPSALTPLPGVAGDLASTIWLPTEEIAQKWVAYVTDTSVADDTPPPAPENLEVNGSELHWEAKADLESGLAAFIIERDGVEIARLPEKGVNNFGRPVFQNLSYSDTPTQPLVTMKFSDETAEVGKIYQYRVRAINTVGLVSE